MTTTNGDGTGITQDAVVTLSAFTDAAIEVSIDPSAVTAEVEPGGASTRFEFGISLECEEAGSYVVHWEAVIAADQNADATNDTVAATSKVRCRADRAAKVIPR